MGKYFSTVRLPYVSIVRGHAVVTVGSCTDIRLKILVNVWDISRVIHRFVVDDISLHNTAKKQRYHNLSSRVLVSVPRLHFEEEEEKKKKYSIHF